MKVHKFAMAMSLLILLVAGDAQAQTTGTIAGQVTDRLSGEPIAGVQVHIPGTRLGVPTNNDGRYLILNVPAGTHTVATEYIGYGEERRPQVVVTADQTTVVNFTLRQAVLTLSEVVVTGVTEATSGIKAPFTVGRVSRENIATVPTTNSAVASIQGKVAGASIVRGSGQPGTGVSVQLRSPTSIAGNNGPMYVVDGVILNTGIGGTTVDLESLDIESVEVVKGAAAASLYGSRAASGVIAITTNRGRNLALDQTRITVRSELGTSQAPTAPALTKSHPYLQNEQGQWVDTQGNVVTRSNRVLAPNNMMDQPFRTPVYDNVGEFFRPAQFMQSSVNLSHRAANTNFLASATRYDEAGTLETNEGFVRDNFRLNLDHRLRSDFRLQVSAQHSRYDRDLLYAGVGNVFWDLLMYPRDINLGNRDVNGGFLILPDSNYAVLNPLWYEASREYYEKRVRTLASVDGFFTPIRALTVQGTLAYDRSDLNRHAYTPKGTPTSVTTDAESGGYLQKYNEVGDVMNASVQANFTHNIGELSLRTVGRALIEREAVSFAQAIGQNFYVVDVPRLNAAADRTVASELEEIRSTGYFVEQNFDYAGRYILTALARRDGSSLFGPEARWHNYYRVGGAWRLAQESWWGIEPLTEFKLRYAIGTAGGRPNFAAQYETWSVSNTGAVSKTTLGNRDLKPSHAVEQEMGVDLIVDNRYSVQLTHARQRTSDQIVRFDLPAMFGYPRQWINAGTMEGNTWEATIEAQLMNRPNMTWSTTFVADRSRSKVTELDIPCYNDPDFALRFICSGWSLGDMRGERFLRSMAEIQSRHGSAASEFQINDDGFVVWVGAGNDYRDGLSKNLWGTTGMVDGEQYRWGHPVLDRDSLGFTIPQKIGSSDPDASFGWLNNFFWRGFNFHTQMHAQVGGNVYNRTKQRLYQHERSAELDQSGKDPGLKKTLDYYQWIYNRNNNTDFFVEDGSFLKLRAVSVQYRLNQDHLDRFGLGRFARGVTFGVNARNLLTLSGYSGFDPEVGSVLNRHDNFSYPNTRSVTLTTEITF